jgi:hypothetical protein
MNVGVGKEIQRLNQIIEQVSTEPDQQKIQQEVERLASEAGIDPRTVRIEKTALQ